MVVLTDDEPVLPKQVRCSAELSDPRPVLRRRFFTDFPFSGEVNFLTTGAVAPGEVLSPTALPRGVAYLALAAPTSSGEWSIRAAMSEGDLSSWIVAGSFASKPSSSRHTYSLGLSYSTQDYMGGNPAALAAVTDGSRNVGELYAFDRWAVTPGALARLRRPLRALRLSRRSRPL